MRIPALMVIYARSHAAARRGVLVAGAAAAVAVWGAWAPALASARVPAAPLTETFTYVGTVAQMTTVPAGATFADVRVVGGKGGSTRSSNYHITGGDGAQVTGRIAVSAGQVLTLKVAGHGGDATGHGHPGAGGWGATGTGGRGGTSSYGDGAGGGGASSIEISGSTVALAGGGGGAGGDGGGTTFYTGGAGGSSGTTVDPGHNGTGAGHGNGGGGAANGVGAGGAGGNASWGAGGGGGGGAGQAGGGGGSGGGFGGGGGGGGGAGSSRYTAQLTGPSVVRGATGDGNGLIAVTWNDVSAPVCFDQAVAVPFNSPGVPVRLHCTDTSRVAFFVIESGPSHGHLEHQDPYAGTFTYVPDRDYAGPDSMRFRAFGTGEADSGIYTVTFNVAAAPMTPVRPMTPVTPMTPTTRVEARADHRQRAGMSVISAGTPAQPSGG
jgi:hypothetical protein